MLYAETQVRAGMDWLDARADHEWRHEINLETLNMGNENDCILGQLFGDYTEAAQQFDLTGPEASGLGFYRCDNFWYVIPEHEFDGLQDPETPWRQRYELLTQTWKELLQPVAI